MNLKNCIQAKKAREEKSTYCTIPFLESCQTSPLWQKVHCACLGLGLGGKLIAKGMRELYRMMGRKVLCLHYDGVSQMYLFDKTHRTACLNGYILVCINDLSVKWRKKWAHTQTHTRTGKAGTNVTLTRPRLAVRSWEGVKDQIRPWTLVGTPVKVQGLTWFYSRADFLL